MTRAENVLRWLRGGKDRRLVWNGLKRAYKPVDPDDVMAVKKLGMVGYKVVDHLCEAGHVEPHHRPLLPTEYWPVGDG